MKRLVGFLCLLLVVASVVGATTAGQPLIRSTRINGNKVTLTVSVPKGARELLLESHGFNPAGAWKPKAILRVAAGASQAVFVINRPKTQERYRVSLRTTTLPTTFFQGRSSFPAQKMGAAGPATLAPGVPAPTDGTATATVVSPSRAVVESDIWKVAGNRLYLFNQYRGLQVLDISQPDHPAILGTLPLAAAGDQMYLLDATHVVLLARACQGGDLGSESEVLIVDVATGVPAITAQMSCPGFVTESRLVGSALYVASTSVYSTNGDWGMQISPFDLSSPAAPIARPPLAIPSWYGIITASDEYFFVSSWDTSGPNLRCIDITAPDGTLGAVSVVNPEGYVADKFKINQSGEVLTVISQRPADGSSGVTAATVLQTWSLANPLAPEPLGRLEFSPGETLTAARFDGNRVYVSTTLQTDPLFIIDLSNPAEPQLTGSLEIPGSQSYIYPLGNRLISIGTAGNQDWRTVVSLFDVTDPAQPALLSQVPLGNTYSWSEAAYNDKALTVLADAGMILVPYDGDTTNGYASQVQLIDLNQNGLTPRGTIAHTMQTQRTAVVNHRILAISGWQLLTVDATDRDHPQTTSELALAWPVDRVLAVGGYLLEFGAAADGNSQPVIRICPATHPDQVTNQWELTGEAVLGATVRGNRLYLLEGNAPSWRWAYDSSGARSTNHLQLSVIDLTQLPQLKLLGQIQTNLLAGSAFNAVWPAPGVLVWAPSGQNFYPYPVLYAQSPLMPAKLSPSPAGSSEGGPASFVYPWYSPEVALLAFDVRPEAAPAFCSRLTLTNGINGAVMGAGNLVYASHAKVFVSGGNPYGFDWSESQFLDVIDFSDPTTPVLRDPVSIPGTLLGIGVAGEIVYTQNSATGSQTVDALAYDGVAAYLVASLPPGTNSFNPAVVVGGTVVTATGGSAPALKTWQLGRNKQFQQLGSAPLAQEAYALRGFDNLVVAENGWGLQLLNLGNPANPVVAGGVSSMCLWPNLDGADGSETRGLWLPLGSYGVNYLPVK